MPDAALPELPEHIRLTPEFRLLAAASWAAPPALIGIQAGKIASLCNEGNIDWNQFILLVDRHRVPVLAYLALRRHAAGHVPDEIIGRLKDRSAGSRIQALRHAAELVRLVKIFSDHGIGVIPLKGLLLSQQLYDDPCIRHAKDLDIMVRPEHIDHADRLLKKEGYVNIFPGFELTERQKRYLNTGIHHFEYMHRASGLNLELHWRSWLWTAAQTEELWAHSHDETWLGASLQLLEDDFQFLYLCDHGAGHRWYRLKWLSDIAMMLAQERPAVSAELVRRAEQLDLKKALAQTALLIHWLYGIRLPEALATVIHDEDGARSLAGSAMKEMLLGEQQILDAGKRFGTVRRALYLRHLKPAMPRSMILKGILMSPEDFKLLSLPAGLFFLYIPLRPFLWLWRRYLKDLFKCLF